MGSIGLAELVLIGVLVLILLGDEETAPEIARKVGRLYKQVKEVFEDLSSIEEYPEVSGDGDEVNQDRKSEELSAGEKSEETAEGEGTDG